MHALDEPSSFGISGGNVGRFELPPVAHVHRLDRRPLPWLWIWTGIAIASWTLAGAMAW